MRNLPHPRPRAFTLVEIMIAVVIIGLLAALAIPAFKRVTEKSEHTTIANDLRIFAAAFEQYSLENGTWPANGNSGVLPPEMSSYLSAAKWAEGAVGNTRWDWENQTFGVEAAISMFGCNFDDARLARLDELIDDGNITTGAFRRGTDSRPMFVLAE